MRRGESARGALLVVVVSAIALAITIPLGLIAGPDRTLIDGGFQTVEYADTLADIPADWDRLDTSRCEFEHPKYGPEQTDPCGYEVGMSFFASATFDPCCGPGLDGPEATEGYIDTGDLVVYVAGPDADTARRVLGSARTIEDPVIDVQRWEEVSFEGLVVDVPEGVAVSMTRRPGATRLPGEVRTATTQVFRGPTGWLTTLLVDGRPAVRVIAPTRAIAEVVASSVRLAPSPSPAS